MAKATRKILSNTWKAPLTTIASAVLAALLLRQQGMTWENAAIAAGITALGAVLPDPKALQGKGK